MLEIGFNSTLATHLFFQSSGLCKQTFDLVAWGASLWILLYFEKADYFIQMLMKRQWKAQQQKNGGSGQQRLQHRQLISQQQKETR